MKKLLGSALVVGLLALTPRADAALKLSMDDGIGGATIIADGGAGDLDLAVNGSVLFTDTEGIFYVTGFGLSKPVFGSTTEPHLDIGMAGFSTGAGTLVLMLTDTDFTANSALNDFIGDISASSAINGNVSIAAYLDDGNGEFALTTHICSAGPTTGTLLSCLNTLPVGEGDYSVTLKMIWNTNGAAFISADGSLYDRDISRDIPEPSALLLLGSGMVGIAGWSRGKFKKA